MSALTGIFYVIGYSIPWFLAAGLILALVLRIVGLVTRR